MMTYEDRMQNCYARLKDWLEDFRFGPDVDASVYIDYDYDEVKARLYTFVNTYTIHVGWGSGPEGEADMYIMCEATTRKERPGEWWHRSRDIASEDFTLEGWGRVLAAIVSYECVDPALPADVAVPRKRKK